MPNQMGEEFKSTKSVPEQFANIDLKNAFFLFKYMKNKSLFYFIHAEYILP